MKNNFVILIAAILLTGCEHYVQTTSGQAYLSQYSGVPVEPSISVPSAKDPTKSIEVKSIDQRVREVAAVEPILKFPARIGLARIEGGAVTPIPPEDADSWTKARKDLGEGFGEFVPLSPMVMGMVEDAVSPRYEDRVTGIISKIRLGAARQHLDAVLVYEVLSKGDSHSNILSAANVSIIGGFVLPSKSYDAEGMGSAMLIDVVQGYPYGTVTTAVPKKSRISSSWGWGSDYADEAAFESKIKTQVATQLADESVRMFLELRTQLAEKRARK